MIVCFAERESQVPPFAQDMSNTTTWLRRLSDSSLVWSILSQGVRVGGYLLVLPIALRTITEHEMEIWWLFVTAQGLAVQADFGLGTSIGRGLTYMLAGAAEFRPNVSDTIVDAPNPKVLDFLAATAKIYTKVIIVAAGILLLFSFFVIDRIKRTGAGTEVIVSWFGYSAGVLLLLASMRQTSLLNGADKIKLVQRLQLLSSGAGISFTAVGLSLGLKFYALAGGSLLTGLIQYYAGKHFVVRTFGRLLPNPSSQEIRAFSMQLWPIAWKSGMVCLGAFLIYNSNVFWASKLLGQPEASRYPLTLKVMQLLMVFCSLPLTVRMTYLTTLMAKNRNNQAWNYFLQRHAIGLAGMICAVLGLYFFGNQALQAIDSQSRMLDGPALLFMGLIFVLEFNHAYFASILMARNEFPFILPAFLSGIAIFIGSGLAGLQYGLWGILICVFVVQLSWNNWWVPLRAYQSIFSK